MKYLLASAVAALAVTGFSANAATNLVTNGSFEATTQAAGTWNIYSSLPGWTSGPRGVELRNDVAGSAFDGNNFIELDTTGNSFIAQAIATSFGEHYTLSFSYSARPGTASLGAHSNDILVMWGLKPITLLSATNATSEHQWSTYSFDVTGSYGHSTVLSFWALGKSDTHGGSLDNISLTTPVPEPETYALMLGGLAALGMVARRRRQPR
ncbi:FxDxF family PEP-CTERM protein [Aquincola sp. MAHUQ-54]|uniref:FxDxF family PEP-CTERM protein n=1 Tax=Aquincola agrisoli TaxID=3119538 RepID=A0AAW9Q8W9_9BURK